MRFYKDILMFFIGAILLPLSCYGQKQKDSLTIIDHLNSLNYNYYQSINKNPTTSLSYAKEAFSYYDSIELNTLKFKVASNLVTALFVNERYNEALSILDSIESLEVQENNKALYHTLRGLVENDLNHITEAEAHYKKALELYIKLGDKDNEFTILNNLGLLYNNIGDYKRSLELYLNCYEIINDLKIKVDRYKYYVNIGTVSYNLNDYNSAVNSFTSALNEANQKADTLRIFRAHEKIAQTYVNLNDLDIAVTHYNKALEGYGQLGLKKEACNILLNLGDVYRLKGDQENTFKHYGRAQKMASKHSFLQENYQASLNLGIYFQDQLKFDKASRFYKEIVNNKTSIANLEILKEAFNGLYLIEKTKGNSLQSLDYLENYLKYDTSIKERQLITQNEQIEIQYNLKQKEFELENLKVNFRLRELRIENQKQQVQGLIVFAILIAVVLVLILTSYFQKRKAERLLSAQNKKINLQNKELLFTNKEIKARRKELANLNKIKDQLLAVIAHDVKSPMTDLYNLLFILRHNLGALHKDELKKNLAIIESSTSNLLNLLNNILNWVISQSSGINIKASSFSLHELIDTNLKLIESSVVAKELTVTFSPSENINMFKSDLNIVDFALRNLLSNAVKFTNKKGTINIDLIELPDTQIEIRIADSGIGFKEEIHTLLKENKERVPTTSGTNTEKGYGIGLSLCKKMLAKINSRILYEKNDPIGSIFILQLKPIH